jgi:hypothetical protein
VNFALAQSMVHRPRVLRGGKAPLRWKRDLSRLTEGLGAIPRTCDWITEIAETHPRLLYEPLLGRCLSEVTSKGSVPPDRNDQSSDPANRLTPPHVAGNRSKEIVSERVASLDREQVSSPVFEDRRSKDTHHSAVPSNLPRRASDSLLRRVAPDGAKVVRKLVSGTSALPHGRAVSPPLRSSQQLTRSEWLQVVADRAVKRLLGTSIFPSTRKFSSPAVAANKSARASAPLTDALSENSEVTASPATLETNSLPSIGANWLLSIRGQQASPQLLASLVKHASSPSERGPAEKTRQESLNVTRSEARGLPSAPDLPALEKQRTMRGPEFARPLERMFDGQTQTRAANNDRSLALPSESTFDSDEHEQPGSPNFTPTVLTPALSPLLPPASAGSAVLPVAADAARRSAWRDEVDAHETDLSVLAAQVKRILDEEARRHGIDV